MDLEKPITTQEELDQLIKSRLERDRESQKKAYEEKYADYVKRSDFDEEIAGYQAKLKDSEKKDDEISNLTKQINDYKAAATRTKIAHEAGLPFDLADRIKGTDEESMKADAKMLAALFGSKDNHEPQRRTDPAPNNSSSKVDPQKEALRKMLHDMEE